MPHLQVAHCLLVLCMCCLSGAFRVAKPLSGAFKVAKSAGASSTVLFDGSMFAESGSAVTEGLLKRERYIASNRFNVRPGKETIFEARWANRKSRLAKLDGFRFFTLMKKIQAEEEDTTPNYVSFTIWENKDNFDAWRTGEAFKEAHGGGSIMDFMQLIGTALFILKGKPRPAFFDAVLPISSGMTNADLGIAPNENGWRDVAADGKTDLPADVIVAQDRFSVRDDCKAAFEKVWQERESKLKDFPGFFGFFMQRRDASVADDGVNYIASSMWQSKAHFDAFKATMLQQAKENGAAPSKTMELLNSPPKIILYEGKLALLSSKGP